MRLPAVLAGLGLLALLPTSALVPPSGDGTGFPAPIAGVILPLEGREQVPLDGQLPDLVPLAPGGFTLQSPDHGHLVAPGCRLDELEPGLERCLRFPTAIGNVGTGPLELRAGEVAPDGSVQMQQLVPGPSGWVSLPTSWARPHAEHGHHHFDGVAEFRLFASDPVTGQRGPQVATGVKVGFCLLDSGTVPAAPVEPAQRSHGRSQCRPDDPARLAMGIASGWYDLYKAKLSDQSLDITGLPDGQYEFVVTVDPDDLLAESDESNNVASAVLRLEGDRVDVLSTQALYGPA